MTRAPLPTPPGHRTAFTLIEAIAVIVVLSIAFPPMLWALHQAHNARVVPARMSVARWLAAEKLENVIADRHSTTRGYTYLTAASYPAESSVTGFTGFTRSVAFAETAADLSSTGAGFKRVTVTVGFQDGLGTPRSFSLTTIVTDY